MGFIYRYFWFETALTTFPIVRGNGMRRKIYQIPYAPETVDSVLTFRHAGTVDTGMTADIFLLLLCRPPRHQTFHPLQPMPGLAFSHYICAFIHILHLLSLS